MPTHEANFTVPNAVAAALQGNGGPALFFDSRELLCVLRRAS